MNLSLSPVLAALPPLRTRRRRPTDEEEIPVTPRGAIVRRNLFAVADVDSPKTPPRSTPVQPKNSQSRT